MSLVLRRGYFFTLMFSSALIVLSAGFVLKHESPMKRSWTVLRCVYVILFVVHLRSRMIRRYLDHG